MNDIVGIDLGTTNSLIGVMDSGFPILIADATGARLTPSVVLTHYGMPHVDGLRSSASSSRSSGRRRNRVEIAISASMRASWAPRQK